MLCFNGHSRLTGIYHIACMWNTISVVNDSSRVSFLEQYNSICANNEDHLFMNLSWLVTEIYFYHHYHRCFCCFMAHRPFFEPWRPCYPSYNFSEGSGNLKNWTIRRRNRNRLQKQIYKMTWKINQVRLKHVYATIGTYPNTNVHFDCINWMNHVVKWMWHSLVLRFTTARFYYRCPEHHTIRGYPAKCRLSIR